MFSLVVRHKTIQALLDMMSVLDLELEKFNVKIVFLHGNLEDNTYMSQKKGFLDSNKDNVCFFEEVFVWFEAISKAMVQEI